MSKIVISLVSLVLAVGSVVVAQQPQATNVSSISFDDFMRLDVQKRRAQFGQLDAANKAVLVKTHAERWLAKNRNRLGASEQAFIEEAIGLLATPEAFQQPVDPQSVQRQEQLTERYRCRIDPFDVSAAFDVLDLRASSEKLEHRTYLSQAKCWIAWFAESAIDLLPSTAAPNRK